MDAPSKMPVLPVLSSHGATAAAADQARGIRLGASPRRAVRFHDQYSKKEFHMHAKGFRRTLGAGAACTVAATLAWSENAAAQESAIIDRVIVTAQKREESIQDVPIAVSAFTADELTARGLDGGPNILQAIPNVTFAKTNFTAYNLQIRGVGTKLIGGSGDLGVGIHLNNAPLAVSKFFEAEFFDIERIELLRGPQGTVYGRNATGGVFNAITAKPTDEFAASVSLEGGNYETRKVKAMVNLPLGDAFGMRLAGSFLERDGYNYDPVHDRQVDGRNIFSGRATLSFQPNDTFNAYLLWEHFEEDDDRQRAGKQLCTKDPGQTSVGGQSTTQLVGGQRAQWYLSQGCLPGSIYAPAAFSTINSTASLGGVLSNLIGLQSGDAFANKRISSDLRTQESPFLPRYFAKADIFELNLEINPTESLTLTSLTSYNRDRVDSRQDYNRAVPTVGFNNIPLLAPGGVFTDPQVGVANGSSAFDISFAKNTTWTEELRLQSSFDGPLNFNVGAIYLDQETPGYGYYVLFNAGTAYALAASAPANPIYVDPSPEPVGDGHNYFFSWQPYELRSIAGFGELYWQMSDAVKWTLGVRYTDDKKNVVNYPIQLAAPGRGFPTVPAPGAARETAIYSQEAQFKETTGRFGVDWKLSDDSLLYAFYSRGYKGGGFNPSGVAVLGVKQTFDPEFVNAFEIGAKNTFADGKLRLNATGFYYDYDGYQVSRVIRLTVVNDNIDAKIHGVELEAVWQPLSDFRIDGNIGYLHSEIKSGLLVDVMNRTQGDPSLTVVKGFTGTNCVAPTAAVAQLLGAINAGLAPVLAIPTICPSATAPNGGVAGITPTDGVPVSIEGNELPNSPHWTVNVGVQKSFAVGSSWRATLRGDYYHQTNSYSRIFNTDYDRLQDWSNVNASLSFDNDDAGWNVLLYVKNVLDDDNIVDAYLTDDSSGLWTNTFLSDPRLYGASITKRF
jgi:outer membrane receptor protein involved in Fe transport